MLSDKTVCEDTLYHLGIRNKYEDTYILQWSTPTFHCVPFAFCIGFLFDLLYTESSLGFFTPRSLTRMF
jgi:hypothetical protein